jgi:hypothetical protein
MPSKSVGILVASCTFLMPPVLLFANTGPCFSCCSASTSLFSVPLPSFYASESVSAAIFEKVTQSMFTSALCEVE